MISLTPLIKLLTPRPLNFDGIWLRQVEGAAQYAQVDPDRIPTPHAWVIRAADRTKHAGERAELLTLSFDIVIAVSTARNHQAGEADDELLKYRQAIKTVVLGWQLPQDSAEVEDPIKFNGGRVLRYAAGDLVWADNYSFEALITNYLPDPLPFESAEFTKTIGEPV